MVWLCHHSSEPSKSPWSTAQGGAPVFSLGLHRCHFQLSLELKSCNKYQQSHAMMLQPEQSWTVCEMLVENQLIKECRNRVNVSSVHIFCVYSWPSMVPRVPSIPSLFGPRVLSNPKFKFELHLLSETARRWPQRPRHKDHSKLSLNAFAFFHTWKSKDKMWIAHDCSCIVIWRSQITKMRASSGTGDTSLIWSSASGRSTWTSSSSMLCGSVHTKNVDLIASFSVSVYLSKYCNVAYCSAVECKAVQWKACTVSSCSVVWCSCRVV